MNEAQEQIAFDPSVEHPEETGVPEDLHVDFPFPMLIATVNNHAIVAKVHKNQFFSLAIIDLHPADPSHAGRPLKAANIRFGATPPNVEVGRYWNIAITTSAQAFYAMFQMEQHQPKLAVKKPSLAVIQGGVVTQG